MYMNNRVLLRMEIGKPGNNRFSSAGLEFSLQKNASPWTSRTN